MKQVLSKNKALGILSGTSVVCAVQGGHEKTDAAS